MPHHFHHKTAPGRHRRLLDLVHRFHDTVQGRVCADAELGAGQVIIDRSRQADDWDVESRKIRPGNQHGVNCFVSVPAAYHQQGLNMLIFDDARNRIQVAALRNDPAGAQHGSAQGSPAAHAHPMHFLHFAFGETLEAVLDPQHDVALVQTQPDGCPGGVVHPGSGSTRIQDTDPETLLIRHRRIG